MKNTKEDINLNQAQIQVLRAHLRKQLNAIEAEERELNEGLGFAWEAAIPGTVAGQCYFDLFSSLNAVRNNLKHEKETLAEIQRTLRKML